jgi:phosphoribosylanthranilate isomerase
VGFIFYQASPRYVGADPDPALFRIPESRTRKVGVFVNEPLDALKDLLGKGWLDMVQLHGNEPPAYCEALSGEGWQVIKAVSPGKIADADLLRSYSDVVDYFLFDTPTAAFGGSGRKFNWQLLESYGSAVPFFLSGGIGPEDALEIRDMAHPGLWALDLNSRFEQAPGLKDMDLLAPFMKAIRKQ